jgi:hypothetical protein
MDKVKEGQAGATRWGWLPAAMPGVARLIKEKRRELGEAHVSLCWQRGVVEKQPGWFFAREGALAVGTPWDDQVLANFALLQVSSSQALVVMRPVEAARGA